MKHLLKSLTILSMVFLFTVSCKKDELVAVANTTASKFDLLTAKDWKFASIKDEKGNEVTETPAGLFIPINIADIINSTYRFQKDKTLKTKLLLDKEFSDQGKWELKNNEKTLSFDIIGTTADTEIIELTANNMTLKYNVLGLFTYQLIFTK